MANRAYLYSDDRPDAWDVPEEGYYDSRWNLPLAWFFLFKPADVRLIDVGDGDSQWQEVRLSAEKDGALGLFELHKPLLLSVIGDRLGVEAVAGFARTVREWPGRYLLVDPHEILDGFIDGTDREHAEQIAIILTVLEQDSRPADAARQVTRPYVGELSTDPERFECQILGYTYW